ncbi:CBS domain-containing protein [Leptolyngbya sp. 7M]|uniref:CBS domain-containing protein n=1 Tax=Leptolyngbya sp. 7M TaxID=2812896 RepID=UPI001B8B953D|nr:CBS domain-containing protein [Leptolyngbya sp. 7M]QYO65771.1 CBS domain-containing protein [Leptolyngbya sp. 7M]
MKSKPLALSLEVNENGEMQETGATGMKRSRCREIMTSNVRTASPANTLREVAEMMRDGDMGSVPVVSDDRLVGIVTDRDIVVRSIAEGNGPDSPVSNALTTEIFSVGPDDFVFEAVRLMGEKQVRRIPVVNEDGSLAGIISMADVALEMEDEREIAETLEEISSGAAFWSKK